MISKSRYTIRNSPKRVGPYSRWLRRGAANKLNAGTPEARFMRAIEVQFAEHLGGEPTIAQRMLISRLARIALRIELFEQKFAGGSFTDLDSRAYGALNTHYRLLLRSLGIAPPSNVGHRQAVTVDDLCDS